MKEAGDLMSEQSQHIHFHNTNRWSTRELVTMALMGALAAILMYVQIPLIPAAPFLMYDPSLVPAIVCAFSFGPAGGVAVAGIAIVIHALTTGDWVGALMNLIAALGYLVPCALLYAKVKGGKTKVKGSKGAVACLVAGVVGAVVCSIVGNLTVGVAFWYGSFDVIVPLLLPAVLPFNIFKGVVNSGLVLAVYGTVSNFVTSKKARAASRA